MGAQLFGHEAQGDFLLVGVRVDINGTARDQVFTAIEVAGERSCL